MKSVFFTLALVACHSLFSQNVGIGTNSPTNPLEIVYNGSQGGLRVRSTASFSSVDIDAASGEAALRLFSNGTLKWLMRNNPPNNNLEFYDLSAGSRMTIQSATGNIGIGTTGPVAKLHVQYAGATAGLLVKSSAGYATVDVDASTGEAGIRLKNNGISKWAIYNTTGNDLSVVEDGTGTRLVVQTSTGNVGIGTTNPLAKLDVNGYIATSGLQIGNGTAMSRLQVGTATIGTSTGSLVTVNVPFPVTFGSAPKVIVTARSASGTNYDDTFAVTVRVVTTTGFTVNIKRVDNNTAWGQNLLLDWIAIQ